MPLRVAKMPWDDHGATQAAPKKEEDGEENEREIDAQDTTMNYRRTISVASLLSGMVALYLHLWKLGLVGSLACSGAERGCEFVQLSVYGKFLGVDVALIGAVGYAMVFIVATAGTLDTFVDDRRITRALQALIWPAIAFTAYLKYAEFVRLRGFCPWCLVSALTIVLCAVMVTLDSRRFRRTQGTQ